LNFYLRSILSVSLKSYSLYFSINSYLVKAFVYFFFISAGFLYKFAQYFIISIAINLRMIKSPNSVQTKNRKALWNLFLPLKGYKMKPLRKAIGRNIISINKKSMNIRRPFGKWAILHNSWLTYLILLNFELKCMIIRIGISKKDIMLNGGCKNISSPYLWSNFNYWWAKTKYALWSASIFWKVTV